ncbi:MAG: hypothetical protein ACO1OH_04810 [Limnobacter sp.]|jgi:hypothetical protein
MMVLRTVDLAKYTGGSRELNYSKHQFESSQQVLVQAQLNFKEYSEREAQVLGLKQFLGGLTDPKKNKIDYASRQGHIKTLEALYQAMSEADPAWSNSEEGKKIFRLIEKFKKTEEIELSAQEVADLKSFVEKAEVKWIPPSMKPSRLSNILASADSSMTRERDRADTRFEDARLKAPL